MYLPGDDPENPGPLARFLPQVPDGIATSFLATNSRPGNWVLDPFGAAPRLDLEMASLGYRVLVAVNNPITRFILETAAQPPSRADFLAALAELAATRKGNERLESHLQSLYLTECNKCHQQVPADAFVWKREGWELEARIYHCSCGESGEYPATEADQALAASIKTRDDLHRSRALERVASPEDSDRSQMEQALDCYLPRAIYVLINIINKLVGFADTPEKHRALLALMLVAFDETDTLWSHPPDRPRPKILSTSSRFLEKNAWLALERAPDSWSNGQKSIECVTWPSIPGEGGGICLFEGPMRHLARYLKEVPLSSVVTVLPRPNQAFWILSTLWASWLWGREAAYPFKSTLIRRRYDWNWHAAALYSALKNLSNQLALNVPFFAIMPESEPAFLSAVLLAAAGSGFDLNGLAIRSRHDPIEILWHRRAFSIKDKEPVEIDPLSVRRAMVAALQERGEPTHILYLHAAGLIAMSYNRSLRWRSEALPQINAPILAALEGSEFIHHAESKNPEVGLWGLLNWGSTFESLPDRVEAIIVRLLQENHDILMRDLEEAVNAELPGLLTPSLGLLRAVLNSYAIETDGHWSLRLEDIPSARRVDLEDAEQSLITLASRLGISVQHQVSPQRSILWQDSDEIIFAFYLLVSSIARQILKQNPYPPKRSFLVLPGSRASLLAYKMDRDPDLKIMLKDWRIIKFRVLRNLSKMTTITREHFEEELISDPIEPPEQMQLF